VDRSEIGNQRSEVYALLAKGFAHPDATTFGFFRSLGEDTRCLLPSTKDSGYLFRAGDGVLGERVRALLDAAREATPESLSNSYMRLFDPVGGPFPYEAEMKPLEDFSKAQLLADIMGFYRAFGVEPRDDRPDHLAAELEFMHYLALKEQHALDAGRSEDAAVCRDAQEKFLRDHLLTWADSLAEALRPRLDATAPFYARLLGLLDTLLATEKERCASGAERLAVPSEIGSDCAPRPAAQKETLR